MPSIARLLNILERAKDRRKQVAERGAKVCERRYRCRPDPLHAWTALWWCHQGGAPIPDWVADYLGRAAGKLITLEEGKEKPEFQIARALEFSGHPQKRKERLQKKMQATWRIIELVREDARQDRTLKEEPYFLQVAEEFGVSKSTVHRWVDELLAVI